jgi:hypothetical protein
MTLARESVPAIGLDSATTLIPGAREPGMLTTFGARPVIMPAVPAGRSTMDALTIAEHEREGGGAPSQRTADV